MSLTDCKSKSPQEALERLEQALRNKIYADTHYLSSTKEEQVYREAKAELLVWMSYIP